jgi:Cof subfamily protein (haloacid dehalogenase superfamily)
MTTSSSPAGLFITDLDGTLLTDNYRISEQDLQVLNSLRSRNIVTAIATGRSYYSFSRLMKELDFLYPTSPLGLDYVIISTGAGVMEFPGRKILKTYCLPHHDIVDVSTYLEHHQIDYMVQKPVPESHHFIYSFHGKDNPDFHRRVELYKDYASPLTREKLADFGKATQVICIVPYQQGDMVTAQLRAQFPQLNVIKATSPLDKKTFWIEIFPKEVSKSRAAIWLAARTGLSCEQVCAVGNDYNDEDLLHWAGASYITDNGPDSLKEIFHRVCSNNKSGVASAADHWLRGDTACTISRDKNGVFL